jgi:multidrug efflux system membrane fusion protein
LASLSSSNSHGVRIAFALLVPLVLIAGYFGWRHFGGAAAAAPQSKAGQVSAAIPVTVARVKAADVPVYLNGLGTVEPYDTVTVRSRVDGEITKIAFKQGDLVKEGDVLVQIDPRPYQAALDQAVSKKAQDEATLQNAKLDLQRYSSLASESFSSQQQLDTQRATVNQLTAQIQGDQAAIDNAATQLSYTTIRAPLAGKTGFRLVDQGNIVHAADTTGIVTIVRLQPISVVLTAPEEEVPRINKALAVGSTPVAALASDGAKVLSQGELALVNNEVDQASGTISMKATFDNADDVLWPGLSVSTRLLVDTIKQATVIPDDAVQHGPNGLYVFTVDGDNKAQMTDIKVGYEGEGQAVVLQGLTTAQNVVIAGQYRLQNNVTVQAREQQTSPAAQSQQAEKQ